MWLPMTTNVCKAYARAVAKKMKFCLIMHEVDQVINSVEDFAGETQVFINT